MSIIQTDVVDFIGIDNLSKNVILSILDDLNWSNEHNHLLLLQEKINLYLSFIESGEIYDTYPLSIGKKIEIEIYFKHDLPYNATVFLEKSIQVISDAGFNLKYSIFDSDRDEFVMK